MADGGKVSPQLAEFIQQEQAKAQVRACVRVLEASFFFLFAPRPRFLFLAAWTFAGHSFSLVRWHGRWRGRACRHRAAVCLGLCGI
jgi:hypothetical protein